MITIQLKELEARFNAIAARAVEMDAAAKAAAGSGMFETGAALRNKAAGLHMALAILTGVDPQITPSKRTEVECLVGGGRS